MQPWQPYSGVVRARLSRQVRDHRRRNTVRMTALGDRESEPAVVVSDLTRCFGSRTVLRGLSLSMSAGERLAVLGDNGAGKTTLLRCVAGSLRPSSGSVQVGGRPPSRPETRAQIGAMLPGDRSFALRLSGDENLRFFARLRLRGDRRADAAVEELAGELALHDILDRRVSACSSGMAQQLAFARALLGEPAVLVLDEPTRSLDDNAIGRLWAALDRRPQLAVLIATHRAEDVARCSARLELSAR
jgi:ABC-2 type transport system ATP-binding protein